MSFQIFCLESNENVQRLQPQQTLIKKDQHNHNHNETQQSFFHSFETTKTAISTKAFELQTTNGVENVQRSIAVNDVNKNESREVLKSEQIRPQFQTKKRKRFVIASIQ